MMDKFVKKIDRSEMIEKMKQNMTSNQKRVKQARLTDLPGVSVGQKSANHVKAGPSGQVYKRQSRCVLLKHLFLFIIETRIAKPISECRNGL